MSPDTKDWLWEIKPAGSLPDIKPAELLRYKDLVMRFVKRDHIVSYRQTVLGPLWVFLEPLIATYVYFMIFTRIFNIPTDNVPPQLFFLAGVVIWSFFSEAIGAISPVFHHNASVFSKVYFPRIIVPVSLVLSKLTRFGIQCLMLLAMYLYYVLVEKTPVRPNIYLLLVPVLVLVTAFFSLGVGLVMAALAARYRDVQNLMMFAIRLMMFATPVFYPFSLVEEQYRFFLGLNPLTPILEAFRYALFGTGNLDWIHLLYGIAATVVTFVVGLVAFGRVEQNVIDTV
ncbi:ABC transporter permease [Foetidibacter luteolus]|uniref:ABC transporter permease n=1 Tax=Foetidibacter luteolus TaxID=2608880 RepID=UPI00129A7003|nr:ABC transporter permease [Foetidibacter luteolus]